MNERLKRNMDRFQGKCFYNPNDGNSTFVFIRKVIGVPADNELEAIASFMYFLPNTIEFSYNEMSWLYVPVFERSKRISRAVFRRAVSEFGFPVNRLEQREHGILCRRRDKLKKEESRVWSFVN